ncbi:TetR/AcrR family transcriptional regulator [Plastoroseomonas hellenica]|uniref:TetR/AcrR family transcriptional regulator n=1 Tax=Plastoroseomonas hellenica TaxID=2687306 RepID=UPI001BAA0E42|nr:TetR/AcrR family transcriptional regulator [Plastoroseomonas hellenica]MBR0641921.1 TetR/AcrR family transcriptional regulator [Plastoroseomonas hellenica]
MAGTAMDQATRPEAAIGKQARRSAEMRRRLCQAALDALCEVGYDSLTTPMIAARAGVSRGAQTHHFATKADMLVGVLEYLVQIWDEARLAAFGGKDLSDVPFDVYLRFAWREIFGKPSYIAALELMLAARVDRELGQRLRQVLDSIVGDRNLRWRQLLRFPDVRREEQFQYMTLCLLRGMAIHASFNRGDDVNEAVLEAWIEIADKLIAMERPGAGAKSSRRARKPVPR